MTEGREVDIEVVKNGVVFPAFTFPEKATNWALAFSGIVDHPQRRRDRSCEGIPSFEIRTF